MKRLAIIVTVGVGMVVGLGFLLSQSGEVETFNAPKIEIEHLIEEVPTLDVRKQDAWEARESDAQAKAQAAYEEVMRQERLESDLDVVREFQTELDELEIQLMASTSLTQAPVQKL